MTPFNSTIYLSYLSTYQFLFAFQQRFYDSRTASNIKRNRAAVSPAIVNEFFTNFQTVAEGVPGSNIFNYDETNLTDNPGAQKKFLFRKGVKYTEKVMDTSKTSISVMFAGSAAGQMLPPYVVYRGNNLWKSWCKNGPVGTRYSVTQRGWFDMQTFEDWFETIFLPIAKELPGRKILLGDNLASHISLSVIGFCRENNVEFVCLPPSATHLLQPLDVSIYAPMKAHWKAMLREYKELNPSVKIMEKTAFPSNLKMLVDRVDAGRLMPAAFEKCGIFPVNEGRALERLPSSESSQAIATNLDNSLIQILAERQYNSSTGRGRG